MDILQRKHAFDQLENWLGQIKGSFVERYDEELDAPLPNQKLHPFGFELLIAVYCKLHNRNVPRPEEKIKDYLKHTNFPTEMEIPILSEHLGIPTLQDAVNDIANNYLVRPASKKWILCDYPEKQIKTCLDADKPARIPFPKALESLLPAAIADTIRKEWTKRFPNARVV